MSIRIQKLRRDLRKLKVDSIFISGEENIRYLTGFTGDESFVYLTQRQIFFLTDTRYVEQAQHELSGCQVIIRRDKPYPAMVEGLRQRARCRTVGFEAASISHALYVNLCEALTTQALIPTYGLVERQRLIKNKAEVTQLRKAVQITAQGIRYLRSIVQPGMTEKEIQAKLEYHTKIIGSEKPAFETIIAAGAKSSMPHAISDHSSRLENNSILLVDMGVVCGGYHSDLTRCIFTGKIPPLKRRVYDTVLKAQELGIRKVRPGIKASYVDAACRDFIHKRGYGKYFGHGTGHGVGLQIHEAPGVSPRSNDILKPGMVITVEPGIYLPRKFGVRIEDMVLVTASGSEVLTRDIDK